MPKVPEYGGPQIREAPLQGGYQAPVDVTRNQRVAGAAITELAGALDQRQYRNDQDAAFSTSAQLKTEWLDFESKLRTSSKGRNAADYDTKVEAWWQDASKRYGQDLTPGAKVLVGRDLTTSQLQAVAGAKTYKEQQLNASADASYKAAQSVSINEAATVGNEAAVIKALSDMEQKRKERAVLKGWTPEEVDEDRLAWSTTLHGVVVTKLARTDPATAQVYYDKYKSEIGAPQQAQIEAHLEQTNAVVDGSATAGAIWNEMGPKADGQPVELDKMEAAAREKFKSDPVRQKAAIADIQQRAASFNAAERERTAGKVNEIMGMYANGATLTQIARTPMFQSLPGAERAKIQDHITDRNHMLWARTVEDRARIEREMQQKTYPAFLEYSNPDVLATMTRQQVQALQPSLGNEMTGHLVTKWDALQKPAAKLEAKMDSDDFNHIADGMGLKPFDPTKTEEQRRQLGELKYRTETLINQWQVENKKAMPREEKLKLFADEMARTVTVKGFFSNSQVPVIQLTPDQLSKVAVPEADREKIATALQTMYTQTKNPLYAPTEENMRRLYLLNRSRAAALLPAEK